MSRLLFTVAAASLLVGTLGRADQPAKPTPDRVKRVRQMYKKLPCGVLPFTEPSKEVTVRFVKDGGSIAIDLVDAKGKQLTIQLDRKMGTRTRDALCLWIKDGQVRLPPRGPEESAVYGLLLRLPKADRDEVEEVLKVLDWRFAGATPVGVDR
jgi:hypothetical protein